MKNILCQNVPESQKAKAIIDQALKEGFRWEDAKGVISKLREELDELEEALNTGERTEIEAELGDVLWTSYILSSYIKCDSEYAIGLTNKKFVSRYVYTRDFLSRKGLDFKSSSIEVWLEGWSEAKRLEKGNSL